jgi:hypothetical protein
MSHWQSPHRIQQLPRKIGDQARCCGFVLENVYGNVYRFPYCLCVFLYSPDGIDSRFGLSVGSLFAVIGNKYIIDSSLPESTSFTLVDTLHGLTLLFILCTIAATAYSLTMVKKGKQVQRFDMIIAQVLLGAYAIANIYFITNASGR